MSYRKRIIVGSPCGCTLLFLIETRHATNADRGELDRNEIVYLNAVVHYHMGAENRRHFEVLFEEVPVRSFQSLTGQPVTNGIWDLGTRSQQDPYSCLFLLIFSSLRGFV